MPVLSGVLLVLLGVVVLIRVRREQYRKKRLRLLVRKLYASKVFEKMKPFLRAASMFNIEEVRVDKTGITLRYMNIRDCERAFLMKPNGFLYLTEEQQEAMRCVLEECLPGLALKENYHLSRKSIHLLNGSVEYAYCYTISHHYKAMLNRSRQFMATGG